jgi:hypothetical protein
VEGIVKESDVIGLREGGGLTLKVCFDFKYSHTLFFFKFCTFWKLTFAFVSGEWVVPTSQ